MGGGEGGTPPETLLLFRRNNNNGSGGVLPGPLWPRRENERNERLLYIRNLKREKNEKKEPHIRMIALAYEGMPSKKKMSEPQFIRLSSNSFVCLPIHSSVFTPKKSRNPNSLVCLPIHSYVFPPKKSLNPNSFVCLQIHSYVFQTKLCISIPSSVFQFIRMSSNSFVCLPKKN